jgi:glycosyltransferase involved in cell wall biosynthesis
MVRLLYHCAEREGGLAEYSRHQAAALVDCGQCELLWQAAEGLPAPAGAIAAEPLAVRERERGRGKFRRAVDFSHDTLAPFQSLAREIERCRPDAVLLSTWSEYFSPLWAPKLGHWRNHGVRFGAVIHDPVRDFVRGPLWWHRYSVRKAYSFLNVAFTHDAKVPDTCGLKSSFRSVQIPHGPYSLPIGKAAKEDLRSAFGIAKEATLLLSFGHIRDGKNLDKIIAALPDLPNAHLLVAGREQSGGQRPVAFYKDLAQRLGVAHRCHWHTDYIPNEEVWKYYRASDLLLLTYSQDFRSASGVLNVNAQFGLPIIASAGGGPLLAAVNNYNLGVVLPNADGPSIAQAVPLARGVMGEWRRFSEENSWKVNAERVMEALAVKAEMRKR